VTLSVNGVSFGYRRHPVLHDIDVAPIEPGTLTVLIGPNAAGKSTLFRCIAGLLVPSRGTISLEGEMQHRLKHRDWSRRVCYLPQSFACQAALSRFDVVLLARKHLNGRCVDDDDVSSVAALLQRLDMEPLADTFVGDLSGGQQQMVSIAQALVRAAPVPARRAHQCTGPAPPAGSHDDGSRGGARARCRLHRGVARPKPGRTFRRHRVAHARRAGDRQRRACRHSRLHTGGRDLRGRYRTATHTWRRARRGRQPARITGRSHRLAMQLRATAFQTGL